MTAGFWRLRFDPELEHEYREAQQADRKWGVYACGIVVLMVIGFFCALDLRRFDLLGDRSPVDLDIWLLVALRWTTVALLLAGLLRPSSLDHRLELKSALIGIMLGLNVTAGFLVLVPRGMPSVDFGQLLVMGMFLLIGLTFYNALAVATTFVALHLGLSLRMLDAVQLDEQALRLGMLVMALVVGATGGYLHEMASRRHFLTRRMAAHLASHDALTRLPNRRSFESRLRPLMAGPEPRRIVLALVDIDHFKAYNDRFGHAGGDEILQRVGRRLAATANGVDEFSARVGGEEFAVILVDRDDEAIRGRMTQLLAEVRMLRSAASGPSGYRPSGSDAERLPSATRDPAGFPETAAMPSESDDWLLTASAGATRCRVGDTLESLYQRADRHLYQSKHGGRDQLTADTPAPAVPKSMPYAARIRRSAVSSDATCA